MVVVVVVVFLSVSTGCSSVVVVLFVVVVGAAGATGVTLLVVFLEHPRVVAPIKMKAARLVDFNISASPRIQLSCLRSTAHVVPRIKRLLNIVR